MRNPSPGKRTIFIYLAILLIVVALVTLVLGGTGWLRTVRILLIYAGVFLVTIYLLRRVRGR